MPERRMVERLRMRLLDVDALGSADGQQLVTALREERERFFAQARQQGVNLSTFGTGSGMVVSRTGQQGRTNELDDHSREFMEIMRSAAAPILSAKQLRVFREMQDETFRSAERGLRADREARARASATEVLR